VYQSTLDWLQSLKSDSTGEGLVCLANTFLSWRDAVVPPDVICGFLADCCVRQGLHPHKSAVQIYREVAMQVCRSGLLSTVRLTTKQSIRASTTVTTENFFKYISDKVKTSSAVLPVPPLPKKPGAANNGEKKFRETLDKITRVSDWYKTEGLRLGAPYPHQTYCWMAHTRSLDRTLASIAPGKSKGDLARDALGLIDDAAGIHHRVLLKFQLDFDPSKHAVARPHALAGNRRFSASLPSSVSANRNYVLKWGTTTNLESFANAAVDVGGLPERISTPISLAEVGATLSVVYVSVVS